MPRNRLRELREEHGLPLKEVADRLGIDKSTLSRWETGEKQSDGTYRPITIPDWRRVQLAEMYGVSVPFLMGYGGPVNPAPREEPIAC